jgi:tetratricopeptide (TPR) repeat protein
LGDFQSAANVLEQGNHYREAAVLYKDHLNNLSAAAACLERGGLLLEAIELYDKLNRYETVGDLYQKMEQPEKATRYYEQSVGALLANKDYLDASRIMEGKLKDSGRAMQTLFNGWRDSGQSEACLKQYLGLLYEHHAEEVSTQLEEIFAHHTPKAKKTQLLHVLTYIIEGKNDPELLDTSRNIAYQIISEQLEEGKLSHVHTLQKFLPQDPLLSLDSSRFISLTNVKPVQTPAATSVFNLDKSIQWISATAHRNQFLALGIKDTTLHLARGNWYGNMEYYSWSFETASGCFRLLVDPLRSNHVLLHSSAGINFQEKKLPKNKYFDEELIIHSSAFLGKGIVGMSFNPQGGITALATHQHKLSLHQYTLDNHLQQTVDCTLDSEILLSTNTQLLEMIYRNTFYYTYADTYFFKIAEDGTTGTIDVNARIKLFAASTQFAKFRIALSTDQGCVLLRQIGGELRAGSDFFAQDIEPVDIQFMFSNTLIVAGRYKLVVFDLNEEKVSVLHIIETQSQVAAILPTSNRRQFAYLTERGEVFTYLIE